MSDERQSRERGPWAGCVAVVLALGLPCYVLSTGPFVWLVEHGYVSEYAGVIYFPLAYLVNYFEPVEEFLKWYLSLWL